MMQLRTDYLIPEIHDDKELDWISFDLNLLENVSHVNVEPPTFRSIRTSNMVNRTKSRPAAMGTKMQIPRCAVLWRILAGSPPPPPPPPPPQVWPVRVVVPTNVTEERWIEVYCSILPNENTQKMCRWLKSKFKHNFRKIKQPITKTDSTLTEQREAETLKKVYGET